jgi:hypothetical protein
MSLTYDQYVAQVANIMVIGSTDANFQTMLPGMIDYAEGRCYRELDLLAARVSTTVTLSSGVRTVALSTTSGYTRVVENLNVYTSTSVTSSNATRSPLTMVSRDFIDAVYPSAASNTGVPLFAAMASDSQLLLGPPPSAGYTMEVVGTIQPTPLSSGNSTTFLTLNLPDLFVAASMVFGSGYMRDFGAQADNKEMSGSWESQYQTLFQSANTEALRQKYQSGGWTHAQPSPIATPPRA